MYMRYEAFTQLIDTDPSFLDFRRMLAHEPLRRFVYHEKCILGPQSETRIFHNALTNEKGGIAHSTQVILDDYYGVYTPFRLKGVWIPLSEGVHYSILPNIQASPLIRQRDGQAECLYFVHPKSESIYEDLLTHYRDTGTTVSAFSLSSPRSLLVALPKDNGDFEPVMVKVSLNQQAHGVLRLLSERECALTVANTSIFSRILDRRQDIPLQIFRDTFSFVPKMPSEYEHGMIYREIPGFLKPGNTGTFAMPLLALYGQRNSDTFKRIVQANGGTPTEFLRRLFRFYLDTVLPLLLDHELSMEVHGQNLVLTFDDQDHLTGIIYRDMGGVNTPVKEDDYELPVNLRKPELSYFVNHQKDAANAVEHHWVWRGLYPLTKQLVKNADYFRQNDPEFNWWYEQRLRMQANGIDVLGNWTDLNSTSDLHHENLDVMAFNRYGYVEWVFTDLLIRALEAKEISQDIVDELKSLFFNPEELTNGQIVAPCTYGTFFDTAIHALLAPLNLERTYQMR